MKKSLMLATLLCVCSNSAYATKARLLALGMDETDNEGSYYIDDNRNIFLNAANINNYADSVILEWGDRGFDSGAGIPATTGNTTDQSWSPQAEGGFLKSAGNYTYGLYFGAESNTSALLRSVASAYAAPGSSTLLDSTDNQLDIFFGTTLSGMKVGADFVYASNKNEGTTKQEDSAMAIKLGAIGSNWDGFANISLKSNSKAVYNTGAGYTHEFDGQFGLHIGGGYEFGNSKVYGNYKTFKWDQKDSNALNGGATADRKATIEGKYSSLAVGYAHTTEVSSSARVYTSIAYRMRQIEADFGGTVGTATATKTEAKNTRVPVVVGYEADATSWLTLRGSIRQNITGSKDNKNYDNLNAVASAQAATVFGAEGKGTMANSTNVNAGATLNFGKLKIDGVIGAGTAYTSPESGVLELDNLLTRVGMTYNF